MDKTPHMSDADLISFADRELPPPSAAIVETHLKACAACQQRLRELQNGSAAYEDYHEHVLQRSLPLPEGEWPSLRNRLLEHDRKEKKSRFRLLPTVRWAAVAFACALAIAALYFYRRAPEPEMSQLLAESASLPSVPHARLLLTANGHSWLRPAVLRSQDERSEMEHVRILFVKARYNWADPLSARSFAEWRQQLPEKRDRVTTVRDEEGRKRFYRLQTRTSAGSLRAASLMMRVDTSHPVNAAFEFEGKENVEMQEQPPESPERTEAHASVSPAKTTEALAGPEDELRVFAALNAIGADTEEPIAVNLDASRQHVIVTGTGLLPVRQKEVEEALRKLPNTIVRFDAVQRAGTDSARSSSGTTAYSADTASAFRQSLESRAGGAQQFQLITDRALEASNKLFAQAHALLVLARKFPPEVEGRFDPSYEAVLRALRQRHAFALEQTGLQLSEALKPLLNSSSASPDSSVASGASWQKGAGELFGTARNLDATVSRLLAGYSAEEAGEKALNQLPNDLLKVEQLARAQQKQ